MRLYQAALAAAPTRLPAISQFLRLCRALRDRKNWPFSGSPRGAHASATPYSLIETAKAIGVEPYRYLRYLFTKSPLVQSPDDYRQLTPQHLDLRDFQALSV